MKDRIMRAFIEEIQKHGMKFTMDDLAKRLGISKRTLYEQYSSKVEILEAIIEQSFKDMDDRTEEIIQNQNISLLEKIRKVLTVLPKHYQLYDLRLLEQMKRNYPDQWIKVESSLKDDWDMLQDLMEKGMKEGQITNMNVALMMKVLIDATNSTLDQQFYMQNNISVSDALSSIADMLLYGLVPRR